MAKVPLAFGAQGFSIRPFYCSGPECWGVTGDTAWIKARFQGPHCRAMDLGEKGPGTIAGFLFPV